MPGDHHAGLGLEWNLVFHAYQNGVGSDLSAKGDAGLSMNVPSTVEFGFMNGQACSTVVGLPMHIVDDLTQREQFLQQRLVDFVPACGLERSEGLGGDLLETFALHLSYVDAAKQQTFLANFTKQIHVHAVGRFGFTVETGDEVEAWQQFGQTTLTPNASVFVDEPNRRLELYWIAIQPIGFVNTRVR